MSSVQNARCFEYMANVLEIDNYDLNEAVQLVSEFGSDRYGFVVTPNVDHVIRHFQDYHFRALYARAAYVLLDSRFLAHTVGLFKRQILRVCLGSDLTTEVLSKVIRPNDVAILVGGTTVQAQMLRARFGLKALYHVNPPMNFIHDQAAVEQCLNDIESSSPFRFCFLAIGSPQQEIIASKLQDRGVARGLALCVGAAVNYLTGIEKRAPNWMQQLGFEWLFRLLQNPRRLAGRYLVRGPLIFPFLFRIELRLRRPTVLPSDSITLSDSTVANSITSSPGQAM
jgi:N-acetylglucosaminyldiphosphoundecaprenol N-acetyl-beta-D-mannosaminyltransferase